MEPDPGNDVDVRDAVRPAPGADEVVAVLQTDLEHAVEALGLLGVACALWVSIPSYNMSRKREDLRFFA